MRTLLWRGSVVRACDVAGCPERWPCPHEAHGRNVGGDMLVFDGDTGRRTFGQRDATCTGCGYHVCACAGLADGAESVAAPLKPISLKPWEAIERARALALERACASSVEAESVIRVGGIADPPLLLPPQPDIRDVDWEAERDRYAERSSWPRWRNAHNPSLRKLAQAAAAELAGLPPGKSRGSS